jgi:hypothetical protein
MIAGQGCDGRRGGDMSMALLLEIIKCMVNHFNKTVYIGKNRGALNYRICVVLISP